MRVADLKVFKGYKFEHIIFSVNSITKQECEKYMGDVLETSISKLHESSEEKMMTLAKIYSIFNYLVYDPDRTIKHENFKEFYNSMLNVIATIISQDKAILREIIFLRRLIVDNIKGTNLFE